MLENSNPNPRINRSSLYADVCPHSAITDKSLPAEIPRREVSRVNPGHLRRSSRLQGMVRPYFKKEGVSRLPRPVWLRGSNPGVF